MAKPIPLDKLPVFTNRVNFFPEKQAFTEGAVIPVDKPKEWSSFDVVKYIRNRIPVRKVGHAGTLDPLATGLLLLCCGRATKSISQIQEAPKTYIAEITFGASTPSFDAATNINDNSSWDHLSEEELDRTIKQNYLGEIVQVPPVYSALWKDGQRMYKLARKGIDVKPEPRQVVVHSISILNCELPRLTLEIKSGKGFYVRSLASDLGRSLGTLGYLSNLRRIKTGAFSVTDAWSVEGFKQWSNHG